LSYTQQQVLAYAKELAVLDRDALDRELEAAVEKALPDYAPGGELTIFTAIDGDEFCEYPFLHEGTV
jgi:hypothetical protein